jgi:beta-galactosidase
MPTNRRQFLAAALAAAGAKSRAALSPLTVSGDRFLWNGKPHVFRSGEMHYPRVPREYWRDRMQKARSLGLNAICTYVFWNLHEPKPGQFDFSGNLDLAAYLRAAQAEQLMVLLRPGPYICSEWEFGGFPAWLLANPELKVRSSDPRFLAAAGRYLERVGKEVAPLQSTHGGPIVMVQVENEYGSFGADHEYMAAIRRYLAGAGFDVPFYTADGSNSRMLSGGTLPETLSVINFGGGDPAAEFANFSRFRPNVPRMCGEYWVGWFDHWGEQHHTTRPEESARGLDWMLSRDISCNLYMFHGGSSWGYMSGANFSRAYEPDISGYDYDSPLDEAGRPTAKFTALREVIRKCAPAGTEFPDLPKPLPLIAVPRFELTESAPLIVRLPQPQRSAMPITMEAAGQSYGFILYRTRPAKGGAGTLEIAEARDYAVVWQGERRLGTLDRRLKQSKLEVELKAGEPLDILVENMGRVNFGPQLVSDRKGIVGKVAFDGQELTGWEIYTLPLDDAAKWPFAKKAASGVALHRGTFLLDALGDTFLDMRGCGKGIVWVNGRNAGRYWRIGPQQSLFVPASWLQKGANEVIVLDFEERPSRWLQSGTDPVWGSAE